MDRRRCLKAADTHIDDHDADVGEFEPLRDRVGLTVERHFLRTRRALRMINHEAGLPPDPTSLTHFRVRGWKALQLGGARIERASDQLKRRDGAHGFNQIHVATSPP